MTKRIVLSASVALLLAGGVAFAGSAPTPLDVWRQMFERPIRHAMHWHPKYRAHKPTLVKATPDETPAALPAPPGVRDAALPIPGARPTETPAVSAGPRVLILTDIPDAVLPIPDARPAGPPRREVMAPLPTERPAGAAAAGALPSAKPAPGKAPVKLAALTPPTDDLEGKRATAGQALAALGVKSIPLDPIEKGPCTVLDPVAVASLESGDVALAGKAVLNDRMAETVAKWVHDDVVPAAHEILAGDLTGLRVLDSYNCRGRDNVAGAKISEHGFANAIDIGAFRIGKRWIEVGGDKHNAVDDARFLDTIRHAACRRFTTVLGPGEPDHDTHFHLDLGRHGKSGKYTICQ